MNKYELMGKLQEHMLKALEYYRQLSQLTGEQKPLSGDMGGEVFIRLCHAKDWPKEYIQSDCGPNCDCKKHAK